MFKYIAIGLAFITGTNTLGLKHEADGKNICNLVVNPQSLNDAQKAADAFFRAKIPNIASAALASG